MYMHVEKGDDEQKLPGIGDFIKQTGSLMKQMGPVFSTLSDEVQTHVKG